jgi:hypothetical protein
VKQDFITDFTPGQDTIFIQNDNGDNNYAIAYYNSVTADATFINSGAGDVQVVVRRGDYNLTTGTFTQFGVGSGAGADYQVLFMTDGDNFGGTVGARLFAPGAFAGGGSDFNAASHEIAVLGLAAAGGSLSTTRTSCSTADPSALKQGELGVPGSPCIFPKAGLSGLFYYDFEWVLINVCLHGLETRLFRRQRLHLWLLPRDGAVLPRLGRLAAGRGHADPGLSLCRSRLRAGPGADPAGGLPPRERVCRGRLHAGPYRPRSPPRAGRRHYERALHRG